MHQLKVNTKTCWSQLVNWHLWA